MQGKKEFSRDKNDVCISTGYMFFSTYVVGSFLQYPTRKRGEWIFTNEKCVSFIPSALHYIVTGIRESVYIAQWIKHGSRDCSFPFFYFPPLQPANRLHPGKKLLARQTLRYTMKSSVFYDLYSLFPLSNFLQNVYRRKHEIFSYPLFAPRLERLSCSNTLS